MKLAFFDNYKLGVVNGDKIVDVSDVVKGHQGARPTGRDPRRDRAIFQVQAPSSLPPRKRAKASRSSKVKLRAPLPKPEKIIRMAVNYMEDGTLPGARADQRLQ